MNLLSTVVFAVLAAAAPPPARLQFHFIGNAAFHITDGRTTLLSDFPYKSGFSVYMEYDIGKVPPIRNGLTLLTHAHGDHFDPDLFYRMKLAIIAPPSYLKVLKTPRKVRFAPKMRYRDIQIEAIPTPHGSMDHLSYLVTWHGLRLYFTGDTDSTRELLAARNLDVAFITPWLIRELAAEGQHVDTRRVVVYHHQAGEEVPPYQDRLLLRQRERFRVPFGRVTGKR